MKGISMKGSILRKASQPTEARAVRSEHKREQEIDRQHDTNVGKAAPNKPQCKGKKEIGFRVNIREITHIATAQQSYGIKGALKLSWEATDDDLRRFAQLNEGGVYKPEFVPHIEWTNDIGSEHYEIGVVGVKKDKITGISYNVQTISLNMQFTEEFEVENFPFDVQDLSMVFHDSKHNNFVPHHMMSNFLKLNLAWSSITDWKLDRIAACKADIPYQSGRRGSYEKVTVKIQVKRKWKGLIYRLIAWLGMLGSMTWSTFAIPPEKIGDRLSYTITMALTIVAFQWIISNQLPQVNYMTMLDRYNLFVFLFVMVVTVESTLVGYHGVGIFEDSLAVDNVFALASAIFFCVGNIAFAFYAKYARQVELDKLGKWRPYRLAALYVCNDNFGDNDVQDSTEHDSGHQHIVTIQKNHMLSKRHSERSVRINHQSLDIESENTEKTEETSNSVSK